VAEDADLALFDALALATDLLGDAIYSNPLILGAAWQRGWIPLSHESLMRAIELNGVSVGTNKRAFEWGRAAAHDLDATLAAAAAARDQPAVRIARDLDEVVALRARYLQDYQGGALAARYRALVERVAGAEKARAGGGDGLALAVARNYFRLLAIKDEYEVARLQRDPQFLAHIAATTTGHYRLNYHLAPPLLAPRDRATGRPRKLRFGPWMAAVFALLARGKFLRGSVLDVFGYTRERRMERALVTEYEQVIEQVIGALAPHNRELALRLAQYPESIRGFGHVKVSSIEAVRPALAQLRAQWQEAAKAGLSA
jgi:indolepyruvate ferredoxin oxidoreductase